jgi:hypothetical protein
MPAPRGTYADILTAGRNNVVSTPPYFEACEPDLDPVDLLGAAADRAGLFVEAFG